MDHRVVGADHIVTLDATEAYLMLGDNIIRWPTVVRVLEWPTGGTYVKVSGYRADRNGDPIATQPTSECLMLGHDARLKDFPAWLIDALGRGATPLALVPVD